MILLGTFVLAVLQSSQRILVPDELYGLFTAAQPTASDILHIQTHNPISLDPPTYHLLSHACLALSGRLGFTSHTQELAARMPSILGFLLMQLCLFFLARRLAGRTAGWLAMLLPVATHTFYYGPHGRPYGLLLGLYAASLLCWMKATEVSGSAERSALPLNRHRGEAPGRTRAPALVGLALTIALAITSHFFGLLILVPIAIGELTRTVTSRKLDLPMMAAIAAGAASILAVLPVQKAVMIYKLHYYSVAPGIRAITLAYRRIFIEYPEGWSSRVQGAVLIALTLGMLAIFYAAYRQLQRNAFPVYFTGAILASAALPVFGFLLGHFVTKSFETRYVNPAIVGLVLITALALRPVLMSTRGWYLIAPVAILAVIVNMSVFTSDAAERRTFMAGYDPSNAGKISPSEPVYFNDMGILVQHWYYADAPLRERLTYVYSQQLEIAYLRHDVHFLTAIYMQRFTPLHVVSYEDYLASANDLHPPLTILYRTSWEWLGRDLDAHHAAVTKQGEWLGGDADEVVAYSAHP